MEGQVLNIAPIIVWVVALAQLLNFALAVYGLLASGSRSNARRLDLHNDTLGDHTMRLAAIEQTFAGQPTKDDLNKLMLSLESMKGDLNVTRAEMKGVHEIMRRLEDGFLRHENHLMEAKIR